ncbi:hypothetical protein GBAR_LOCUS7271 [Geodia barretti]|uniref:Uncharacterized protein n=1 Tax=Geodia barretti TaxID=519541 RepID=A0AA35RGT2_GEOBA|nr:hypothetical protein GBAR_LOCUS7271 [Geodia barretti]
MTASSFFCPRCRLILWKLCLTLSRKRMMAKSEKKAVMPNVS